ncbi:major facilitator superfamily domain-containing protein [Mucor mucedo]|uniref:major facilitator superfamily domain-containing protein n=1 Tax=Mucor mucedo TaxID=29922 RepID=UPI0022203C02|nr:major facilitator superfamily domain-containing protein [Mucor mucedo]KAI7888304.1 major facilitator superfamily domain-containing protein [Mucor mucedo]
MVQDIKETVEVIDIPISEKKKPDDHSSTDVASVSTDESEKVPLDYVHDLEWTPEEERAVLNKIDLRLMSFALLMSFVLHMDRTNIANAISDGLPADLGFGITGINTSTLVHSIIFTAGTVCNNVIVKRFGAHFTIPIMMNAWANFSGYIVLRIVLALTEAGFIPACVSYLTGWYKTNELATRLSWFWGIQSFASAFSGLISFGVFRMSGIGGLQGWKWLFLIDGVFTHIVGAIAIFYIPANPSSTAGGLRGKLGWFTEREKQIAVTRIIRDDLSKKDQYERLTWHDVKITVKDTKLWTHLIITFIGIMPTTPMATYFPTLIRGYGFPVTTSNLLTVPSCFIGLFFSILIAKSADRYGNYSLHALIGCIWSMAGFLALQFIPDSAGRWTFYAVTLLVSSSPVWHGMQIAWMSSNLAPVGKRTIAFGAVVGAANICGVPGSQIYLQSDSPRFHKGNWINIGLLAGASLLFLSLRARYALTNKARMRKWNNFSDEQKKEYSNTTKDEGSDRLDFKFRL